MSAHIDPIRTVEIIDVGHDSQGEPTATLSGPPDPSNQLSRSRTIVIPVTAQEHSHLSEALSRSGGSVEFEIHQSRIDMAIDAERLRESGDA